MWSADAWAGRIVRRARHLLHRTDAEREMNDEMRLHLELEIDDRMRRGMSPDEARRTALVDFGGIEKHKEDARTARGVRPIEDLAQDVEYATRVLRKSPGFTITSALTVAIGIAATAVVFSAANALLLRPLPVPNPRELFVVTEQWRGGQHSIMTGMAQHMYSYRHYLAVRDATNGVFDGGLAGFRYGSVSLRVGDDARSLSSVAATPNYFQVLGLHAALGRLFSEATDGLGAAPAAVISYDMWQGDFAGDSSVVGRTLWVDSRAMVIAGVAPRGFHGTLAGLITDVWIPTSADNAGASKDSMSVTDHIRRLGSVTMFGRLRADFSRGKAEQALDAIGPHVEPDEPWQRMQGMTLDPLSAVPAMARGGVMGLTAMLLLTTSLVLMIAVANIAGMLLARGTHRRREIAVRLALGAGRGRLIRQLITESVLLCFAGGIFGVLLARALVALIPTLQPPIGARAQLDLRIDGVVLALSFGVTVIAGIAAGLTPALSATSFDLLSGLRGLTSDWARSSRARAGFVVSQLAMSLVLLVSAGLFVRALERALHVDPGIDTKRVVVAELSVESHGYTRERGEAFYKTLMDRLRARPEIASASLGQWTPLSMSHSGEALRSPAGHSVQVTWGMSDGEYFTTMGIPVVQGRRFDATMTRTSTPVIIVNETLARRMWPNESPIGKIVKLSGEREVIGVVKDGKYRSLDESATAYAFVPFAQRYNARMMIHVRARADDGAALTAIRQEVRALDPNIALEKEGPLAKQLEIYYLPQRAAAWFIGVFGVVGLVLAVLGVYGVVAYHVAQRTRELGIRLALGASRVDVVGMVLRQGVSVIGVGLAIGLVLALGVGRLASGFLYGIGSADPVTFTFVPLLLGIVALVASYVPARRAARVDPMLSLRAE